MFDRRSTAIVAGAVGGLAWSASLRAYMVELAGAASRFDWVGTFAQILLPGVVIGALLGLAEFLGRTGGRRGWRWLAAAPILFAIAPILTPGALIHFLTTGIGGGAVAVALVGVLGGYAVSGRGPLWGRIVAGVPAIALAAAGTVAGAVGFSGGPIGPRGVWVALLSASLMVIFAFACSIPHKALKPVEPVETSPASSA